MKEYNMPCKIYMPRISRGNQEYNEINKMHANIKQRNHIDLNDLVPDNVT